MPMYGMRRFNDEEIDNISLSQNGIDVLTHESPYVEGEYVAFMCQQDSGGGGTMLVRTESNIGDDLAGTNTGAGGNNKYDIIDKNNSKDIYIASDYWVYGNFSKIYLEPISPVTASSPANRIFCVRKQKTPFKDTLPVNDYCVDFNSATTEYLDLGADVETGEIADTVSFWFKYPSDFGTAHKAICGSANANDFGISFNKSVFRIRMNSNDDDTGNLSAYLSSDTWHHLAVAKPASAQVRVYLDGIERASLSVSSSGEEKVRYIGKFASYANFDGQIDEFSMWKSTIQDRCFYAASIRRFLCDRDFDDNGGVRPMDLTLHPDFSTNCVLWLRMGDGTLDDGNIGGDGLIADQTNATLGSEYWDDVYSTGTGNWDAHQDNLLTNDGDNTIKIVFDDDGGAGTGGDNGAEIELKVDDDLNSNLTVGQMYKLTMDAKQTVNPLASTPGFVIRLGNDSDIRNIGISETTTEFATHTFYFSALTAVAVYLRMNGMEEGDIIWLKNLSLKEVNGNASLMVNMSASNIVAV